MLNKKGDKYYIMISLILGLIVLSLSLYFIFQEFFNEEMIDMESCRQSVILRGTLPEGEKAGITYASFKDDFPLKCKTQVSTIDYEDTERAGKLIADTLAQCWYLFGEGEMQIFSTETARFESYCVPCARIRFSSEVKQFYNENPIDVLNAINKPMTDITYKVYLDQAFQSSVGANWIFMKTDKKIASFKFSGDKFLVDDTFTTGFWETAGNILSGGMAGITLPKYINSSQGDILIFFGQVIRPTAKDLYGINPSLFYFQIDQKPDPFDELNKDFIEAKIKNAKVCDQFDGIPA